MNYLDLLTEAVRALLRDGRSPAATFCRLTAQERLGWDLWLVQVRDPLAWEAGTPERRFTTRVTRMADLERERLAQVTA